MLVISNFIVIHSLVLTNHKAVIKQTTVGTTAYFSSLLLLLAFSLRFTVSVCLKGLAQAKIIKKSVILFRVVRLDIETKFPHFLLLTWLSIIRNQEFRLYI